MEWYFWTMLHNFCFNGDFLFEINVFGLLLHHFTLQNSSSWPVNGMCMSHVIRQDKAVDYQTLT